MCQPLCPHSAPAGGAVTLLCLMRHEGWPEGWPAHDQRARERLAGPTHAAAARQSWANRKVSFLKRLRNDHLFSSMVSVAEKEAGGWQPGPLYMCHETLSAQGAPGGLGKLARMSWLAAGADSPTTVAVLGRSPAQRTSRAQADPLLSHSADTVFSKKLQVCGTPVLSKSLGTIFQIAFAHFVLHVANFTIFQTSTVVTFVMVICDQRSYYR